MILKIITSEKIQAALIGAFVAIATVFIKDIFFTLWIDSKKNKRDELSIFRQYADPLANATMSLLWRLNEILSQKHKSSYLFVKYTTTYAEYKRQSTIYRLASLLGWLRAFRKESTLLKTKDNKQLQVIKDSINRFSVALADGSHVETDRLSGLIDLWKFNIKDCETNSIVASSIDHEIKDFIVKKKVQSAIELDNDDKIELCKMIANDMAENYKVKKLSKELIEKTSVQAIQLCSLTESWIYRDWQDAIGDLMLKETDNENRKYDVIGFYEFSEIINDNSNSDSLWIQKIENVFYDLDVTGANKGDMRLQQLDNIVKSTCDLVLALTQEDKQRRVLMNKTIELAHKLKKTKHNTPEL